MLTQSSIGIRLVDMENMTKTAEEIVLSLAASDEPYHIEVDYNGEEGNDVCFCALCPTKTEDDSDRVRLPVGHRAAYEDGYSVMAHVAGCQWRQAVEYAAAKAAGK